MMKSAARTVLFGLFTLAAVSACRSAGSATPADETATVQMKDILITIERTPCFGTCPVYTLSMTGEGAVTFKGQRFVRTIGDATATVSPDSVAALAREIMSAGYFTMAADYTPAVAAACGLYHTDAPSVTTSVRIDAKSHRIAHYHGCNGAPAALRGIEDAIDRIAGTQRWLNQN